MYNIGIPDFIRSCLPYRLLDEIDRICRRENFFPEEIRVRADRRASLTVGSKNRMLDTVVRDDELTDMKKLLCKGSVYAYKETIAKGYISVDGGIRVGVCGSAVSEGGVVRSVHRISSVSFRLPKPSDRAGEVLYNILKEGSFRKSCLIYAPSGVGKTTLLRSVSALLASGSAPLRVVIVDTREELSAFLGGSGLCIDVLRGYPKEIGTEIAARTLNAQLIICDEIFGVREAESLCGAVNCGIPLLCSAHAGSIGELLHRPGMDYLHKMMVFDRYIRIERTETDFVFKCDVTNREDADNAL